MIRPNVPMSNAERQRQFRERNPGYRNRFRMSKQQSEAIVRQAKEAAAALARREAAVAPPSDEVGSALA